MRETEKETERDSWRDTERMMEMVVEDKQKKLDTDKRRKRASLSQSVRNTTEMAITRCERQVSMTCRERDKSKRGKRKQN